MEHRTLGKTGLQVSRLGFGGARIGFEEVSAEQVGELLNALLDRGITFIDTAACYNNSEELIGQAIGHRRGEYVLATKCGHLTGGATGVEWSRQVIEESIDRSLRRLRTDHLDLVQLHSCSAQVLVEGEAVQAVQRAKESGKTRYIGYSGDGEDALEAMRLGVFDTLQTSFNVVDQQALEEVLPRAQEAGLGLIAKRPIANGALGKKAPPYEYAKTYWQRSQALRLPAQASFDPLELSLRFTLSHESIDTAIVGTTNPLHLARNVAWAGAGPLPAPVLEDLHAQFRSLGQEWEPQG
jgi:aryl-alcohol dehydrogenase-like predicted oxidoreductase